ncbi:MAG TPA: nucleotidyltransferase family protein [Candidatus Sulfotelmatobacter sp.]
MRAMVLAAGLGTRLRPLTDDRPKALVEVAGHTMLEITIRRLRTFGISEVIVNVHHFADMVAEYLKKNNNFGMRIEISREETLLDTGGGLKQAAWFFLENSTHSNEPIVVHNVDVVSTIDLNRMLQAHREKRALATLAVQERKSSRYLLFDGHRQLCGRRTDDNAAELAGNPHEMQALAFSGVHVISSSLLSRITEDGAFSIINSYLRLAREGEKILAFRADDYYWRDLGRPESVAQAAKDVQQGLVEI